MRVMELFGVGVSVRRRGAEVRSDEIGRIQGRAER